METAPIIEARGLVKRFGAVTAVAGIDFAVGPGECFGFLGPNGAGKTTTIRMLHAFMPPTAGLLRVAGYEVKAHPRAVKARLGVVPQEDNLDPDLSPLENLLAYARYFRIPRAEARRRAEDLLRFVELEGRAGCPLGGRVDELSSGMKRRLLVARSLINRPRILILDEPTTGLDPQARHLIWQRLRSLKAEGVTQVLTTHYMDEAARLCDRVAIMDNGRILRQGPPRQLVEAEVGREVVEVRGPQAVHLAALARLDGTGCRSEVAGDTLLIYGDGVADLLPSLHALCPEALLHRPATLEDLFLRLAGRSLKD